MNFPNVVRASPYDGQSIQTMLDWIVANPTQIDGVLERTRMVKEMQDDPYSHYYGYRRPID